MKRERTATTVKRTRTILTSIAISKPGRDPGPIGTFQVLERAKTAESIGSSRGQSQRGGHPASAVCRRCFEPGKPGGRQNGGLQASPLLRGLRTTLVSGVLLCIEVETFPRHHKQRRVVSVYSRPPGAVKDKVPRARARPQAPPMNTRYAGASPTQARKGAHAGIATCFRCHPVPRLSRRPSRGHAQQPAQVFRIGFLGSGSPADTDPRLDAFRQGLRDRGYTEGRTIAIEYR